MRIAQAARGMLEDTILPFWMNLRDDDHGGYYGLVDFDLHVDKTAGKGCILNSRILWFFARAALATGRADLADHARHAYRFLTDHCLDRDCGGVYWSLTCDGQPLDTTKHTYNQAFAIYALASYYRLTGEAEALESARQLFRIIENHCTDAEGYLEAFTRDWQPASNEKLSENGVLAAKTMNTLLHVFEGYAGLYEAAPDERVGQAMRRIQPTVSPVIGSAAETSPVMNPVANISGRRARSVSSSVRSRRSAAARLACRSPQQISVWIKAVRNCIVISFPDACGVPAQR